MKILLLSRYAQLGASSRLRCFQYLPFLRQAGLTITTSPLLPDDYLQALYQGRRSLKFILRGYWQRIVTLLTSSRYDLIWLEKEALPWIPNWLEQLLGLMRVPYIVDYDDAIFHNYDVHPNPILRALFAHKIDRLMQKAALVTVGNDYLGRRAKEAGASWIEYLPTVIDLERYPLKSPTQSANTVTIGWIGSPITARYLHLIQNVLAETSHTYPIRLVLIGSGTIKLDGVETDIRPWSESSEVDAIHTFDIGIMPLPDEPWERGKCGYKLIQYMACAKPIIASPVGVNQQIVEQGKTGFLAQTSEQWQTALATLITQPLLRQELGQAGRNKVETNYCLQVTAPQLLNWFETVVPSVSGGH